MPASLTVAPNPAVAGTTVTVSGTRFSSSLHRVLLDARPVVEITPVSGAFSTPVALDGTVGTRIVSAEQFKGNRWRPVAKVSLQVTPVAGSFLVTPAPRALSTSMKAPTVTATVSTNVTVSPLVRALTIARTTPTVTATSSTSSVRVFTIPDLLLYLKDDTLDEIVVANGIYVVAPASSQAATSLWIGSKFAARTRPITVRADTPGGVTLSGGGSQNWNGLSFQDGAHHQTWDGFKFASGRPFESGVIGIGGYNLAPAHHITIRNITMLPSIVSDWASNKDHCIYFSNGGSHDILIEDYTATPTAVDSALQFHHENNAYNVTVRRMHTVGLQNVISIYEPSVHDVLIEDSDIRDSRYAALNVGSCGANVVIKNVTSTGNQGGTPAYYFPSGQPAGLSMINCSFN